MTKLRHVVFEFYIVIAIVGLGVALVLFNRHRFDPQASAVSIGTALSFVYFVQKQKLAELRFFNKLFAHFNERYDELNKELHTILNRTTGEPLTGNEKGTLIDYFDLCAEEYFYYKQGLIHTKVWRAWCNGMRLYFADSHIHQFWVEEEKTDSYYGFKPPTIQHKTV